MAPTRPQAASRIAAPRVDDAPDAVVLVVRAPIVNACPALVRLRAGADAVPADAMWIAILALLADCMQTGGLRGEAIVLRGAQPARELVAGALAARGVDTARVVGIAAPEELGARLEISLAPSRTIGSESAQLAAPVTRSGGAP